MGASGSNGLLREEGHPIRVTCRARGRRCCLSQLWLLQPTGAQWASPISVVRRGPGPGGRGWGPGPVEGAGALGRVLLAGPTLPFPRLLETCGRQASLLGAVAGRLCGVFCESHCVFAHLPCLQQALLPGRVWPLCPCGCLSVWMWEGVSGALAQGYFLDSSNMPVNAFDGITDTSVKCIGDQ